LTELIFICEKKDMALEFKNILNKINESSNYLIYNLDMEIVLEIINLINLHDVHDRIIVATSNLNKAILITKDEKIIKSKSVTTIWS